MHLSQRLLLAIPAGIACAPAILVCQIQGIKGSVAVSLCFFLVPVQKVYIPCHCLSFSQPVFRKILFLCSLGLVSNLVSLVGFNTQKSPSFKQCATCRYVMSVSDEPKICLGKGHVRDKCPICTSFSTSTKKNIVLRSHCVPPQSSTLTLSEWRVCRRGVLWLPSF